MANIIAARSVYVIIGVSHMLFPRRYLLSDVFGAPVEDSVSILLQAILQIALHGALKLLTIIKADTDILFVSVPYPAGLPSADLERVVSCGQNFR